MEGVRRHREHGAAVVLLLPHVAGLRRLVVGLSCLAAGACGGRGDGAGPAVEFTVHGGNPVLPPGDTSAWDSGLVDPGAMIFHAGRFHMLYNGIPEWPHPLSVGYAASVDGVTWVRQAPEPVFDHRGVSFAGWGIRANSVIVEDGLWALYFSAGDREGALRGRIGRARADSPGGPWVPDADPVLLPGSDRSWDGAAVGDAKVVPVAAGYVMYYTGVDGEGVVRIGRATSADGVRWIKDAASPVLEPGSPGAWDEAGVSDPSVVRTAEGGWMMVFRSSDGDRSGLGVAFSADGVAWRRSSSNPIVTSESSSWSTVYFNAVLATQLRQFVYFEAQLSHTDRTAVHLVTRDLEPVAFR
jgi:predicted GH43/DUF377 family glycosyl hydrolase